MSFRFYEWLILGGVVAGAVWAWVESARGNILADFAAIGLTAGAGILFCVFAVGALKRNAAERAIGTFKDGARFAGDLSYDAQKTLIAAMKMGADIQAAQYRLLLQDSRNRGASDRMAAKRQDRDHGLAVSAGRKIGDMLFSAYKAAHNPADQYADPDAGAGLADDLSDLFVDADFYEGDR